MHAGTLAGGRAVMAVEDAASADLSKAFSFRRAVTPCKGLPGKMLDTVLSKVRNRPAFFNK